MKQKLTLVLIALFTTVGAWAEVLNLTPSNGTYVTSSGDYVNSITFSTTPAVTITASANNMDKRLTSTYLQWHSGQSGSCTYTISVGGGGRITAYSVTGEANTSVQTLTAGIVSHEFAVGTSSSFEVTGLGASSVSFVQTGANASGLKITSISVTVSLPTSEQTEAYNIVQGWVPAIQSVKGLVKNASQYTSNAKESSEGSYEGLLDGEYTTFFHSSWNGGPDEDHYLQIELADPVEDFYFYFKKRSQNNANRPTSITISGSNDGSSFTEITTINSGLPTDAAVLDYTSSKIDADASYRYIRFTVTATNTGAASNGHVFFTFSEFYLFPSDTEVDDVQALYRTLAGTPAIDYTAQNIADVTEANNNLLSTTVEIAYTLTDPNGATYNGTYRGEWADDATAEPSLSGAYGAKLSNKKFSDEGGYSFTADIDFGFPVSSNSINNPTAIRSALGNSLWYANDGKVIADNEANTTVYSVYADNYRWYIIPVFSEGTFKFKLYNVGAAKYIPSNPSTSYNTATTLTDNEGNAGAFQYSHYSQGNGFYDVATSKFLTINSSGTGQNIWLWTAPDGTGHMGSVMSFPELVITQVSDVFATLKNAAKFDILDGSTVMGPSEFAAPASINAAIDAAQSVADTDEAKMAFIESANGTMIQNYLNQVATYGALATVKITMNNEYGTMILPCPCTRIDGLDIYSCDGAVGNVLTLTPVAGAYIQNTPYIIHATKGSKYTIIGWNKKVNDTYTSGWLTGALNSTTEIPSGSYMLATKTSTNVQAFYQVSGSGVTCGQNKCYLTVPVGGGVKAFFFDGDDEATAIEELFGGEAQDGTIYNLAGQRISKMQKGINIVNGKKIMVK